MKSLLVFLLLAALFRGLPVRADDEQKKPENALSFRGDYGGGDYHQLGLRGVFQLDETFDSVLQIRHERSVGTGAAGDARAQLGFRFFPVLRGRVAGLYVKEPNSIKAFGFNAGLDWTSNPKEDTEHETVLSLDFTTSTFRQRGTQVDQTRLLTQRFIQRAWLLHWTQELSDSFSTLVFFELNSYASASQGNLINTATDFRRRPLPFGNGTIAGFPHWSFGLGARLQLSEDWRMALDYSRSEIFSKETINNTIAGDIYFQIENDWWLGVHAGYSRQELIVDDLAFTGLSLTYEF